MDISTYKKQYYLEHKQHIVEYQRKYRQNNKERIKKNKQLYSLKKREENILEKSKLLPKIKNLENIKLTQIKNKHIYYQHNKDYFQKKHKQYYLDNREECLIYRKQWKKDHRTILNKRKYERYHSDPLFKLIELLRTSTRRLLKLRFTKNNKTEKLLGCSFDFFKTYFESRFNKYMSWDNFMRGEIHIDHIIPLVSAKTQEEIVMLYRYTNLQPLWATTAIARKNGDMMSIGNIEKGEIIKS